MSENSRDSENISKPRFAVHRYGGPAWMRSLSFASALSHYRREDPAETREHTTVVAALDERGFDGCHLEKCPARVKRDHLSACPLALDPPDAAQAFDVRSAKERSPRRAADDVSPARSPVH